jgi:transglutaminase-like putative cysteine protease
MPTFRPVIVFVWMCTYFAPFAYSESAKHFEGPYHIAITKSQRVRATVRSDVAFPNFVARELWAACPVPPEFEAQPAARVDAQVLTSTPAESGRITDEGTLGQPLVALHWYPTNVDDAQGAVVKAIYEMTITRRALEPGAPNEPVRRLDQHERFAFLEPTARFDFKSTTFRAWLRKHDLKRKPSERDLDFAYRAMEVLHKTHTYRRVNSPQTASTVCARGWGDCGGLSMVFVSTLRANGIPARFLYGRIIEPNASHAKADFYAEGVGWVPCDPAAATHSADAAFGRENYDMVFWHFDLLRFNDRDIILSGAGMIRAERGWGSAFDRTVERKFDFEVLSADGASAATQTQPATSQPRKSAPTRRRRR